MKIESAVIARTVAMVIALLNNCLLMAGIPVIPIEDQTINEVVSGVFLIVITIWNWWKNNSFTKAAQAGDKVMKEQKKG